MKELTKYQTQLLNLARAYWEAGIPIDVDLSCEMSNEGFNVQRLEDKYLHSFEGESTALEEERETLHLYVQGDWLEELTQLKYIQD